MDDLTENLEALNAAYTAGELTMPEYQKEVERLTDIDSITSQLQSSKDKELAETLVSALVITIAL